MRARRSALGLGLCAVVLFGLAELAAGEDIRIGRLLADGTAAGGKGGGDDALLCDLSDYYEVRFEDGGLTIGLTAKGDRKTVSRDLQRSGAFYSTRIRSDSGGSSRSYGTGPHGKRRAAIVLHQRKDDLRLELRVTEDDTVISLEIRAGRLTITEEGEDGEAFRLLRVWSGGAALIVFGEDEPRVIQAPDLGELVLREPEAEAALYGHLGRLGLRPEIDRRDPGVVRYVTAGLAPIEGHAAVRVTSLVKALGAPDFGARDEAQRGLLRLVRSPSVVRHLVHREAEVDDLEVRRRLDKILERTGPVAVRLRLIRDERLDADREYLETLAESPVEGVSEGAKHLLAGLDAGG